MKLKRFTGTRRALVLSAATLAVVVSLSNNSTTQGATITSWNLSDVSGYGPSPLAPNNGQDPNVSVVGLTRGSGVGTTGTAASNAWGGNAWDGTTSAATAVSAGKFASFSITPEASYELSISGFSGYNIRRSGTGPTTGQWQYSLDGSTFTNIGAPITWGATTSSTGNTQPAIDLSWIAALQNIDDSTTLTFRLANWGATGSGGTWYFNGANAALTTFSVLGETSLAIPEPTTAAIAALGLVGLTLSIRRRK